MIRFFAIILTLSLSLFFFNLSPSYSFDKSKNEYVVILHGIARSKSHMQDLADYLSDNNYDVININYPSTEYELQELADLLNKEIKAKIIEDKKVNFIGYSMGGLLVRIILNRYFYKNIGKVIQLAAPNHGSEVADFLQDNWLYKKFYGASGQELITDQSKIKNLLNDKIDYELGIIAGNFTIDPISSAIIPGKDDGKVSIQSTKLQGMKDHIIISINPKF